MEALKVRNAGVIKIVPNQWSRSYFPVSKFGDSHLGAISKKYEHTCLCPTSSGAEVTITSPGIASLRIPQMKLGIIVGGAAASVR